jgi:hypothetical protein
MSTFALPDGKVWGAEGGYGAWEAAVEAAEFGMDEGVREHELRHQADLLRCIFGNPPALAPVLLTPTIVGLAQSAYDHCKLPEGTLDTECLAAALEAAGCLTSGQAQVDRRLEAG